MALPLALGMSILGLIYYTNEDKENKRINLKKKRKENVESFQINTSTPNTATTTSAAATTTSAAATTTSAAATTTSNPENNTTNKPLFYQEKQNITNMTKNDFLNFDNRFRNFIPHAPKFQEPFEADTTQQLTREFSTRKHFPKDGSNFPGLPDPLNIKRKKEQLNDFWKSENGEIKINPEHYLNSEFTDVYTNPYGDRRDDNNIEDFQNRQKKSRFKRNILPFEQVQVGPGVNEGFTDKPSGGFHNLATQEIVRPKTIDELRAKSNPQISYKGLVKSGASNISKREKMGEVKKNRPDTAWEWGKDRWNKTTQILKPSIKKNFVAKYTNRQKSRHFIGGAAAPTDKHHAPINVKEASRNNYEQMKPTNRTERNSWKADGDMSDYGKKGFKAYPNERDITQKRTHKSNLITNFKALMVPFNDKPKQTKKENFTDNSRPEGNFSSNVQNLTVYDPNDIARTTIKETTIDNDHFGNFEMANGPQKMTVYDPTDVAKTTIKETTSDNVRTGEVKVTEKHEHYSYEDLPKITIRNTTETFDTELNINRDAPSNPEQFPEQEIKPTNRQSTSNRSHYGLMDSSVDKSTTYDMAYNMITNNNKEQIAKGRTPTAQGVKTYIGKDKYGNVLNKKKLSEIDNIDPIMGSPFTHTPNKDVVVNISQYKDTLGTLDRIQPNLLEAFNDNPYTQSLHSYSNGLRVMDENHKSSTMTTSSVTEKPQDNFENIQAKIQAEIDKL
jgi:hypothetical protein